MKELIYIENLCKKDILSGISFSVKKGEMVAVMGPSGSGKSTLLYNVSGMDKADSGKVLFDDKDIVALSEEEKASIRLNNMGFVFQNMNMLSNLNIEENIIYPALHIGKSKNRRSTKKDTSVIKERANQLMKDLGIENLSDRRINQVSGGQLQRACICRSMINNPDIIFADEPTGALNQNSSLEVMEAFSKINSAGTTILLVTHDSKVAAMCDRVLFIVDGKLQGEYISDSSYNNIRMNDDAKLEREMKLAAWLNEKGW